MLELTLRESSGSVLIDVVVATGASDTEIRGLDPWRKAIRLRVAARARDGEANREVLRFFGELLDVPTSSMSIVWGAASRHKRIAVAGIDRNTALRRLSAGVIGS